MAQDPQQEFEVQWERLRTVSSVLGRQIEDEFDPDHVIGIERGGLPLAVSISHQLNVPLSTVPATHYDDKEKQDNVHVPEFNLNLLDRYAYGHEELPDSVVIVDDIVDTGETLTAVKSLVESRIPQDIDVHSAAWFDHETPEDLPDVAFERTDDQTWVVFPWEK